MCTENVRIPWLLFRIEVLIANPKYVMIMNTTIIIILPVLCHMYVQACNIYV